MYIQIKYIQTYIVVNEIISYCMDRKEVFCISLTSLNKQNQIK